MEGKKQAQWIVERAVPFEQAITDFGHTQSISFFTLSHAMREGKK